MVQIIMAMETWERHEGKVRCCHKASIATNVSIYTDDNSQLAAAT